MRDKNTTERADETMSNEELMQFLKDTMPRIAVLESQVTALQEAHKEYLKELKELREGIKKDMIEVVSNCRAMQDARRGKDDKAVDSPGLATVWKYVGAAVGGAGIAVAALLEWITKSGGPK